MKKSLPTWLIAVAIVGVLLIIVILGLPTVIDPPPAKSFNERPLEERRAEIEGMRARLKDVRKPGKKVNP